MPSLEMVDRYEDDFVGWTVEQAARLRGMPQLNNAGLDVENLAEEIEDLGRSEINKITSLMGQAMVHLLKIVADPTAPSRQHRQQEVGGFVVSIRKAWSPGYLQRVDMEEIWKDAIEEAGNALETFDVTLPALPEACPFPLSMFTNRGFNTKAAIEHLQAKISELACCRFCGHEDKIVTKELESGYDETEVQP